MRQTIADMKTDLRKMVNASADALANATRLQRQHEKLVGQADEWKGKAKHALEAGREDLARKALARRNDFEGQAKALAPQVEQSRRLSESLKSKIERLKERIDEAERTSSTLVARKNAAAAQRKVAAAVADLGDGDNAFQLLRRFEENVERDEAAALAFDELADGGDGDLADEFAALEDKAEVDDDLAALKAELEL